MHEIVNIKIGDIESRKTDGKDYHTRQIIIKNADGEKVELMLFSDDKFSLVPISM